MAVRWIALAIGLATLAIVGIFLSAVLWPPADVSETAGTGAPASSTKRIDTAEGSWSLRAQVVPRATGSVDVTISSSDLAGRPIEPPARPTALLRMSGMAMGTEAVPLVQDGEGFWRGSAQPSMGGRWILRVNVGDEMIELPFEVTIR
jgi:hypothetical protein